MFALPCCAGPTDSQDFREQPAGRQRPHLMSNSLMADGPLPTHINPDLGIPNSFAPMLDSGMSYRVQFGWFLGSSPQSADISARSRSFIEPTTVVFRSEANGPHSHTAKAPSPSTKTTPASATSSRSARPRSDDREESRHERCTDA
jgi:hypothetical protein